MTRRTTRSGPSASVPWGGPAFRMWVEIKYLHASLCTAMQGLWLNTRHIQDMNLEKHQGLWTAMTGIEHVEAEFLSKSALVNETLNDARLETLLKTELREAGSLTNEINDETSARKFVERVRAVLNKIETLCSGPAH
jgi:hypothetical protein